MSHAAVVADHAGEPAEACDVCGSARTVWRKCKLICLDCQTIVRSCADLQEGASGQPNR